MDKAACQDCVFCVVVSAHTVDMPRWQGTYVKNEHRTVPVEVPEMHYCAYMPVHTQVKRDHWCGQFKDHV